MESDRISHMSRLRERVLKVHGASTVS